MTIAYCLSENNFHRGGVYWEYQMHSCFNYLQATTIWLKILIRKETLIN